MTRIGVTTATAITAPAAVTMMQILFRFAILSPRVCYLKERFAM